MNLSQYNLKGKTEGKEFLTSCINPDCSNFGRDDKYKLSINTENGKWRCFVCGLAGGTIKSFLAKAGIIAFQPPCKDGVTYVKPSEIDAMVDRLNANAGGSLDYLMSKRGLKKPTIAQFRLGYSDEENAVALPFFDSTGACVGIKWAYLSADADPKCRLKKGSKIQAFNLGCVDLTQPLLVTEGEIDCISAWQAGFHNVVSIPNGANGMGEWIDEIKDAPKFYLATDNDSAGHKCAKDLAEKLGLSRCYRVYPRLKDFNEYLQCEMPEEYILQDIQRAEGMFQAPVHSVSDYQETAIEALQNPELLVGLDTPYPTVTSMIAGVRMGEITVFSGLTGSGKSTYSSDLTNHMVLNHNLKAMIISPEMREHDILLGLANNYYRKMVTDADELSQYCKKVEDKLFIADVFNRWSDDSNLLKRVFDMVHFAVNTLGVQFVVIDHMRLFLNPSSAENERHAIDTFMAKCVHTAATNDVHIWLVVQPRALDGQTKKITMHHLKGSGNIIQDAHNIMLIHKEDSAKGSLVEIECPKVRSRLGSTGSTVLEFDTESKANYRECS